MPPEIDLLSMESVTSVFFPFGENKQRKDVTRAKYRNAFITHPDESIVPGLIIWTGACMENGGYTCRTFRLLAVPRVQDRLSQLGESCLNFAIFTHPFQWCQCQ